MRARILYINTHAGQAIREGGVAWAVKEFDPDFVVLVEVGRKPAQNRVRHLFPAKTHSITGLHPRRPMEVESGTLIVAKRKKVKRNRKGWTNRLLTEQRFTPRGRDKMHPVRRVTRATYRFVENPKKQLVLGADHAWTHFGYPLHGEHKIPTEYRKQIRAYAKAAGETVRQGIPTIDVGDLNALSSDGDFAAKTFAEEGMKVLLRDGLDFLLGSKGVRVVWHRWIPRAQVRTDHEALVVDVEIE